MKKSLLSTALLMLAAVGMEAASFTSGGFTFNTLSTSTVEVAKGPAEGDVVIPETVTHEGTTYTVTQIGASAFYNTQITSVTMPNTVTQLASSSFNYCPKMTKVVCSNTLETIGQSAFESCTSLADIILPTSLRTITGYSFYGCSSLPHIVIPEGVVYMGSTNFFSCSNLESISLPSTLETFGDAMFTHCNKLTKIEIAEGCKAVCFYDGILYNGDKTMTKFCPPARKGAITLAPECTSIGGGSFQGCDSLTTVTCPDNLSRIEARGFLGCGMDSVYLGKKLELISGSGFLNCTNLKHLIIPETCYMIYYYPGINFTNMTSLEDIVLPDAVSGPLGPSLFEGDASLRKITIGPNVTSFDAASFGGLASLDTLVLKAKTPYPFKSALYDTPVDNPGFSQENYNNVTLVVPAEAVGAYMAADVWKNFQHVSTGLKAEGDNSAAILSLVNNTRMPWSETVDLTFKVQNLGKNPITSLTGVLTANGQDYPAQTLSDLNIPSGGIMDVTISVPVVIGTNNMVINATQVNGQANENSNSSFAFVLDIFDGSIPAGSPEATYANFQDTQMLGSNGSKTVAGAIKFVDPNLVGCKIIGAKVIGLPDSGIQNVTLWQSTVLTPTPNGEVNSAVVKNGTAETKFTTPIVLKSSGSYFGFTLDIADGSSNYLVLPVSGPKGTKYSFYYSIDKGRFEDGAASFGALQLVLYFDKEGFPTSAVAPGKLGEIPATIVGKGISIPVNIINYSGEAIDKLTYSYQGDGKTHSGTITDHVLPFATLQQNVNIPVDAIDAAGSYNLQLTISQYNDKVNTWADKSVTIPFSVGSYATTTRPVMEENTGLQCGWCPRGTLAMSEMAKAFPDFIGAAYHAYGLTNSTDPMRPSTVPPIAYDAAPLAFMNRDGRQLDPFFGSSNNQSMGIADDYRAAQEQLAPADLTLETSWNTDSTEINVLATAKFSFTEVGQTYKIGYLLTIDGVTSDGTGAWSQVNYYRGSHDDNPLLQTLCDGTFPLYVYNHVVINQRDARGVYTCNSPAPDKTFTSETGFSMADVTLVEKDWLDEPAICSKSNINVVALLLDKRNHIRNAVKVKAGENTGSATGVNSLVPDMEMPAMYYDLMGRRVLNPRHGIFIKVENGKSSKTLIP